MYYYYYYYSLHFDVNAELILLVYVPPRHIIFKDTFWLKFAVCFNEQIATSYLNRRSSRTNPHKNTFIAFIFELGIIIWTLDITTEYCLTT